jgi:hypothetical protein
MDIYINKNMVPTNTFKRDNINNSFKVVYFKMFFGKFLE